MALKFFTLLFFVCAAQAQLWGIKHPFQQQMNGIRERVEEGMQGLEGMKNVIGNFEVPVKEMVNNFINNVPDSFRVPVQEMKDILTNIPSIIEEHAKNALANNMNMQEIYECMGESGVGQDMIEMQQTLETMAKKAMEKLQEETKGLLGNQIEDMKDKIDDTKAILQSTIESAKQAAKGGSWREAFKVLVNGAKQINDDMQAMADDVEEMREKMPTIREDAELMAKEIRETMGEQWNVTFEKVKTCMKQN